MTERELVQIKGDKGGLLVVIDSMARMRDVIGVLRERIRLSPVFFKGAVMRLNVQPDQFSAEEYGELYEVAAEFGIVLADPEHSGDGNADKAGESVPVRYPRSRVQSQSRGEQQRMVGNTDGNALLVKRSLRSGQTVTFDGDVIIKGDVNPGAIVTSTGDIIVLGALRGVAHAGASGDTKATVVAFHLEPTQLRIAGAISRAPDEKQHGPSGPEVARVQGDGIHIEAYNP